MKAVALTLLDHSVRSFPFLFFLTAAWLTRPLRNAAIPWRWLARVMIGALGAAAIAYLFLPVFFEDLEGSIAAISAIASRGGPLYPAMDAPARYGLLYGPFTYLPMIWLFSWFGPGVFLAKLPGVLAFGFGAFGLYRICRKYAPGAECLLALAAVFLAFIRFLPIAFWAKSDPELIALEVASIWAILEAPDAVAIAVTGLAFGVIPNLKFSGVAYLLPIAGLLIMRRGRWVAIAALALGTAVFASPFFWSQAAFQNYVAILRIVNRHPHELDMFSRNVQFSLLLALPVAAVWHSGAARAIRVYALLIGAGMLVTCIIASKAGSASYHLLPYTVPLAHLFFWVRKDYPALRATAWLSRFAPAWALTMLVYAGTNLTSGARVALFAPEGAQARAEIREVEREFPGQKVELGFGEQMGTHAPKSWLNYQSAFDGEPYTLDGAALRDFQFGGMGVPDSTIEYMRSCGTAVWLIPKGERPFSAPNSYYASGRPVLDDRFREAFFARYEKARSKRFFDVWQCKALNPRVLSDR